MFDALKVADGVPHVSLAPGLHQLVAQGSGLGEDEVDSRVAVGER